MNGQEKTEKEKGRKEMKEGGRGEGKGRKGRMEMKEGGKGWKKLAKWLGGVENPKTERNQKGNSNWSISWLNVSR